MFQSTWEAAFIMGKYLDQKLHCGKETNWVKECIQQAPDRKLKILELGSGTGLGGISLTRMLQKILKPEQYQVTMTDICEKALDTLKTNLELN